MPLSTPKVLYGIHSVVPYNRTTRLPYCILKVLGDATLELKGESEDLMGGSQLYAWDSELKSMASDFSMVCREYPKEAMELMLAGSLTSRSAAADGEVVNFANVNGTSCKSSTTGIATVTVKTADKANLKDGDYVIKVVSATTVDVYAMSDVDFDTGTDGAFVDDTLKITTAPLTITASAAVTVGNFGIELNGGSGTIGMTIGDTASFTVRKEDRTGFDLLVGKSSATFAEFGAILMAQRKGSGQISYIDLFRVKASGMPIAFKEKGYSEWSVTMKPIYDSAKDGVFNFILNG